MSVEAVVVSSLVEPVNEVRVIVVVMQTGLGVAGGRVNGVVHIVVTDEVVLDTGPTDCVGTLGDGEVGAGSVVARVAAGLNSSATNPARRTDAATAPRRAALIGRLAAAERVWGTSG